MTAYTTPVLKSDDHDFSTEGGKLAFWKQILPKKSIHYTAKDGSRQSIDFTDEYLADLANNQAVDSVPFMLADADNRHTMDPERQRGDIRKMEVRDDGLYAKIVFPTVKAAKAVLSNPGLGVSARIREGVQRSDGSTLSRGIIHVLGTLDPQVSGMGPWQPTDLSTDEEVLDLSTEGYDDMPKADTEQEIDISKVTVEDVEKMTEAQLEQFLSAAMPGFDASDLDDGEDDDENAESDDEDDTEDDGSEDTESEDQPVSAGAELSNENRGDIELANQRAEAAGRRAEDALKRLAAAEWKATRDAYLSAGVPPFALDLAAPVLNRPDAMVIDLSNGDEDDLDVSAVVTGLLDALKGSIDLSNEQGHSGQRDGQGEDPDAKLLEQWKNES